MGEIRSIPPVIGVITESPPAAGTMVSLCNPELLVLGGGVIRANPWLVEELRREIGNYALPVACRDLRIEESRLENASLRGAELLAEAVDPKMIE